MNVNAFLNTLSNQSRTLPIVILYVTEGCNLQCIMCSYRTPSPNELSISDLRALAEQLCEFGLQHIVYSGGEPLTRRDFENICDIFEEKGVKQTLLTNGLLLEKRSDLMRYFSEVIVSLDGSTPEIHDSIRGVRSFDQILRGLNKVIQGPARPLVSLRSVIQKRNFRNLPAIVELGKSIGADRISFLAADVLSDAFSRGPKDSPGPDRSIILDGQEIREYQTIVDEMTLKFKDEFETGFIAESPLKLHNIAKYFGAVLGIRPFPVNRCNAPMISAVVTSTGEIKPCFFLPAFGNVGSNPVSDLKKSESARLIRSDVRDYRLERCRTCVCTLYKSPSSAMMDKF